MNVLELEKKFGDPRYVDEHKLATWHNNIYMRDLAARLLSKQSSLHFIEYVYQEYKASWHHKLICSVFDDWVAGKIKRLLVFAPPRHGKSLIASEHIPAFIFGKNPKARVIAASHSQEYSERESRKVLECLNSIRYKRIFPNTIIGGKGKRVAVKGWETSLGGEYKCAGVGTGIAGFGFNYGIIDDPIKTRRDAESKTIRDGIIDWYRSTFLHRQHKGASIAIIQTRWHPEDLSGYLLSMEKEDTNADKWTVISLPAILDCKPMQGDPRQQGEALWPTEFSLKDLENRRANSLEYEFSALYQQRPIPSGRSKINREWFNIIDEAPAGLKWSRFWDIAVSAKKSADHTASIACARDLKGNYYFKDMIRGQWEWPDAHRIIINTSKIEKCPIGFELGGQQKGFLAELLRDLELSDVFVKGYSPDADKLTRALPWIARAQAGKVYLIRGLWINPYLAECEVFTGHNDKSDDQIDASSGVYFMVSKGGVGYRSSGTVY